MVKDRSVISGCGIVTAAGSGVQVAWDALRSAQSLGRVLDSTEESPSFQGALLPSNYRPSPEIPKNVVHFLDRPSMIALDATFQALKEANLSSGSGDARRFAICDGLAYRSPGQAALFSPYGQLIGNVLGIRGPVVSNTGNEASGLAALAAADRFLQTDSVDIVIVTATQTIQPKIITHLAEQGALASTESAPFDKNSTGCIPGEAAVSIILEREEFAVNRGAIVKARIAGLGEVFDPTVEPLQMPSSVEAGRSTQEALGNAGYLQNQIDHVVASADGRLEKDSAEADGLMRTFGRHAYYATVTAVAGVFGETFAASGLLGLGIALEEMRLGEVLPVAGLNNPIEGADLAYILEPRLENLDCVLVSSLGMGGNAVACVLQSYD